MVIGESQIKRCAGAAIRRQPAGSIAGGGFCSYRHAAAAATDDGGVSPLPALPSTAKAAIS
uniref:Uncharacterized protein n=1 Tax=Oryza barthii TaxID=65489 RepID=A0A0D3HAY6_9ORYZ